MKILVAAYACRPGAGSEWHVGWHAVRTLAAEHELWVITQGFNRADIEEFTRREPMPNVRFHYIGQRVPWHENRLIARMQDWAELRRWTPQAGQLAGSLHTRVGFDLGHHVTIATWRVPSPLAGHGFPWVWGPVGGGTSVQASFLPVLSGSARFFERARNLANRAALASSRLRRCAADAAVVLVNSNETGDLLRRLGAAPARVLPLSQTFLPLSRIEKLANAGKEFPRADGELSILACGTLEGLKGVGLTLRALAGWREGRFRYRFLGKGSELEHLIALAKSLGIADRVSLGEWLQGSEYNEALRGAHVYLSPSLREGIPVALIEAMAAHCVPVVGRCGGPGLVVTDQCGFSLPVTRPGEMVASITRSLRELASDPARCRMLARAAHDRVAADFTETAYRAGIARAYVAALAERAAPVSPTGR